MKLFITGICGFVGTSLVAAMRQAGLNWTIAGVDNLVRPGSEAHASWLKGLGVRVVRSDLRSAADVDALPDFDWVIDAAAVTSVRAGTDGQTSSRQLVEHNLLSTFNLLELCKRRQAGLILLSTSRVYSIHQLQHIELEVVQNAYQPVKASLPSWTGLTSAGIDEAFSTHGPISLYGASKLASETLAIEYGQAFDFPVWINRCGILAGAGQLGRVDQGILSYWIHAHRQRGSLRYIGFDGQGYQVRDCLHPRDLLPLIERQLQTAPRAATKIPQIINVSGGQPSAWSLRQITDWCNERFGDHPIGSEPATQTFDVPYLVLNPAAAQHYWNWTAQTSLHAILDEIAEHAQAHPDWLALCS